MPIPEVESIDRLPAGLGLEHVGYLVNVAGITHIWRGVDWINITGSVIPGRQPGQVWDGEQWLDDTATAFRDVKPVNHPDHYTRGLFIQGMNQVITFLDTETLGLDPRAPIWEFAAIRREYNGTEYVEREYHCFIDHRPSPWLRDMPDRFKTDYLKRYRHADRILSRAEAAAMIDEAMAGAHIVGAVPSFDTERLAKLLKRQGITPSHHYHLIDVENVVVGWLASRGETPAPPWKSDELSKAIGVDPEQFDRHTAMGDVLWVKAQYDRVIHHEYSAEADWGPVTISVTPEGKWVDWE